MMEHFCTARPELLQAVKGAHTTSASSASGQSAKKKSIKGTLVTKKISQGLFHKQSRDAIKKAVQKLTEGCKTTSLRTDGDRDALEKRHKDFVHLHNAQLDSPNPLTIEQVVAEVHRREAARGAEMRRVGKASDVVEKMKHGEVGQR